MRQIGANGKKTQITINTMGNTQTLNTYAINGLQVSNAFTPFDVATGPSGSPHVKKASQGWILWIVIRETQGNSFKVNRVHLQREGIDETQLDILMKSINFDFPERIIEDKKENSMEDNRFMRQVEKSIKLDEDGHYYIILPFRNNEVCFQNNSEQCLQRLNSLKRKFFKNHRFEQDYLDLLNKIVERGYAEPVPSDDLDRNDGKVWYLPHHGVYHPQRPEKICVVFDCSARNLCVSLNNTLLQGPNLANNL
ncbi:unnamed protein product [Mytilus coruscus]|uniref:Uncharacterized protein n=1 Tax=Mytilus coruscus TaxID=42192 RepID=A0A6J8A667_MYTCO|nr:unnamed protein product [Mytilus coruscus]